MIGRCPYCNIITILTEGKLQSHKVSDIWNSTHCVGSNTKPVQIFENGEWYDNAHYDAPPVPITMNELQRLRKIEAAAKKLMDVMAPGSDFDDEARSLRELL